MTGRHLKKSRGLVSTEFPVLTRTELLLALCGAIHISSAALGPKLMKHGYSTREAAEKVGVTFVTLQRHVFRRTFPVPPLQKVGGVSVRLWSDRDIEKARKALAKVKKGGKKK
jgi:hypothetical protein